MTRIVSGRARGRRLSVPARGTRPTSERTREALFNSLATEIDLLDARVLDLFAGSGAVGLEALSRGAASAVFIESDRSAAATLTANVGVVGLPGAVVHRCTASTYLAAVGADEAFDFVFVDPPYAMAASTLAATLAPLGDERWVAADGCVVVERSSRDPEPEWPSEIKTIKQRRYGEACLWYGRRG